MKCEKTIVEIKPAQPTVFETQYVVTFSKEELHMLKHMALLELTIPEAISRSVPNVARQHNFRTFLENLNCRLPSLDSLE